MYKIKIDTRELREKYMKPYRKTNKSIAKVSGISANYISQILHGRAINKLPAFAFCKSLDPELEVEDIFEKIIK